MKKNKKNYTCKGPTYEMQARYWNGGLSAAALHQHAAERLRGK